VAAGRVPDLASPYEQAILLLDEHGRSHRRPLLVAARKHLESIERPTAPAQAALGYAYDLLGGRYAERALECMREARRLKPKEGIYDVYVPTLLAELGHEKEARAGLRAIARRHKVDLAATARAFKKAFGRSPQARDYLHNGFIHARNFFRSWLADEAERIRNKRAPGRARSEAARQRRICGDEQARLKGRFDVSRVPEGLRDLAPWAARYGVGDDVCRPLLLAKLSKAKRAALVGKVDAQARVIHAWLDSFAEGEMSDEAAAFLYLAQGVEELR
jgi:hypothetical protein